MIRTRPRPAFLLPLVVALVLPGCLAQKADMKRLQGSLGNKIATLDERDKAFEQRLRETEQRIALQQKHAEHLFQVARARSKQDLRELRNRELVNLTGALEETGAALAQSRQRLDDLQHRLATALDTVAAQQQDASTRLAEGRMAAETLTALKTEQQALRRDLVAIQDSLRAELDQALSYVRTLQPTVQDLVEKVDRRLAEQDEALAANAAAIESLRISLTRFRAALVSAIPTFKPPLEDAPGNVTTAPSTPE